MPPPTVSGMKGLGPALLALKLAEWNITTTEVSFVFLYAAITRLAATTVASVIQGRFKNQYVAYAQIFVAFTIGGVMLTLQGPAPYYNIQDPPLWLLIMSFSLAGLSSMGQVPAISLLFQSIKEAGWPDGQETKGLIAGYLWAATAAAHAVGPIIGGYIFQKYGWEYLVTGYAFIIFAALILFLVIIFCSIRRKDSDDYLK